MFDYRRPALAAILTCLLLSNSLADDAARKVAELEKRRAEIEGKRSSIQSKMGLAQAPEKELRELGAKQKKDYENARDDCRQSQQASLGALAASAFKELIAEQSRQAKADLQERAKDRREMITKNQTTIQANNQTIESCEQQLKDGQDWANRASLQAAYEMAKGDQKAQLKPQVDADNARIANLQKLLGEARQQNDTLLQRNEAAQRVCDVIEHATPSGAGPGEIAQWTANLRDAATQEKNTWDGTLTNWEKENDWARRVAAEMLLGMDPAIAISNNPEMILAEMSPVFNEKLMRERAEMYDQMAKGVDEALDRLLEQAAEYKAALPQLEAELKQLDAEINTLDESLAQARAEAIVPLLPRGLVNDDVLRRWITGNRTLAGYPVDTRLADAVVREVRKARQGRLAKLASLVADLASKQLQLSCAPESPVVWLPGTKKIEVLVTVSDGGLADAMPDLQDLVRRLSGVSPTVKVTDQWTFQDKKSTTNWPETKEKVFTFEKPETHFVQVMRTITISVDLPPRHTCPAELASALKRQFTLKPARIKVEVKPAEAPTDIAGRWFGSLTVQTFVFEGGPGEQGCDLTSKFAGKSIAMTLDVQGQVGAGQAVMTAKPPAGQGGDVVSQLKYTTNSTTFTAQGAHQGGTMTLNGRFMPSPEGWSLGGTWSWVGTSGENKGRATGSISLSAPKTLNPR